MSKMSYFSSKNIGGAKFTNWGLFHPFNQIFLYNMINSITKRLKTLIGKS